MREPGTALGLAMGMAQITGEQSDLPHLPPLPNRQQKRLDVGASSLSHGGSVSARVIKRMLLYCTAVVNGSAIAKPTPCPP